MRKETIGGLYLAAGFVLAGSGPTAGVALSAHLGPFTITALSLACALPALAPFALRRPWPSPRELATTALLGLFGIVLYRFCMVSALPLIGAAGAGLLTGAAPALTAVASWTLLGERPTPRAVFGIGIASAGIVLVHLGVVGFSPHFGTGALSAGAFGSAPAAKTQGLALGATLALGAAASESAFAVLSRRAWTRKASADPRSRTALTAAWALLFSALPAVAERPAEALLRLGWNDWLALVWYGVFVTAISYVCWYEGIKRVEASTAAAFTGIVPVVSLALPVLILHERPSAASVAGCCLVALGITAAGSRGRSRGRSRERERVRV